MPTLAPLVGRDLWYLRLDCAEDVLSLVRSAILSTLLSAPRALMGYFWITVVSASNVLKNVWNAAVLRFAAYAWTATPPTLPEYACYNANSPAFRAWTTNQPSARPVPTPPPPSTTSASPPSPATPAPPARTAGTDSTTTGPQPVPGRPVSLAPPLPIVFSAMVSTPINV